MGKKPPSMSRISWKVCGYFGGGGVVVQTSFRVQLNSSWTILLSKVSNYSIAEGGGGWIKPTYFYDSPKSDYAENKQSQFICFHTLQDFFIIPHSILINVVVWVACDLDSIVAWDTWLKFNKYFETDQLDKLDLTDRQRQEIDSTHSHSINQSHYMSWCLIIHEHQVWGVRNLVIFDESLKLLSFE